MLAFSTWMAGEYWKEKQHYRCKEHQEDTDESNILELPSEAPHGAIWPWNGKQYIRIGNTWVQLEEYSINNNYKNKELCTERETPADEEKPNAEQYAPLFEEPENIKLFNVVRKLVELGAEFDIKACGLHITNTNYTN